MFILQDHNLCTSIEMIYMYIVSALMHWFGYSPQNNRTVIEWEGNEWQN